MKLASQWAKENRGLCAVESVGSCQCGPDECFQLESLFVAVQSDARGHVVDGGMVARVARREADRIMADAVSRADEVLKKAGL